ncbi:ABC transporter substrate-binding protein [Acaryochloris marina]|uniref:Amino acid ABC transporter, amino acid-binding protein n=1 Tax=Acaryochloris marina (strain MBIC 11017) TaxID=329726 RepID=B0CDV2_ACAM1|nr:ABC transporter substrate-binding protein [Acaryochloris marina]ABW29304.1 amino acid ABC transporter, amino acid-binding protein [Acaryochloris marina MBIC11017]BDM78227.1 amino acid ABC transporter substrate-binding protein [Acaryochloris marina MBIC10699]
MLRQRLVSGAALGLCCAAISGCQLSAPDSTGDGLKLGTLLPITGDLAQYGTPMQETANLLIKTVNACDGVLGKPVTLISADTQTDPAQGTQAMTKLVEADQVVGVVGAASSASSSAALPIAVRGQVVQISPASTSPVFTERAEKGEFEGFWARTAPPDTFQSQALAQLAKQKGYKSVAILAINNDYGNGLVSAFIPAFKAMGGTVVNETRPTFYDPNTSTFDTEVNQVFKGQPDAVLLVSYPETGSLILKSAQELGFLDGNTALITTDGMKETSLADLVGKNAQGEYLVSGMLGTAPSAGGPALVAFQKRYQDAFQREPSVFDPNTWDATALLVLAAEAAKEPTGTGIREQLQAVANAPGEEVTDVCEALALLREGKTINYQGASGTVDLNPQGDVTGSYDIWSIDDQGKLQVNDTIEITGADAATPPE